MKKRLAIGFAVVILFVLVGIPCYRYIHMTCCSSPPIVCCALPPIVHPQPDQQGDLTPLPASGRVQASP
jgi:hypothetical protein